MAESPRFPFRLSNAFFKSLEFSRAPEVPDAIRVDFSAEIRVHQERFPNRLQIDLKLLTAASQPITFCVEVVGLFDLLPEVSTADSSIVPEFVNERALFLLWPFVQQMIRQVTAQMGVTPINITTPYEFGFAPAEQDTEQG